MIPIRDNIPSRTIPFVGYGIILLSCLAFFLQLSSGLGNGGPGNGGLGNGGLGNGDRGDDIVRRYGLVPMRITSPEETPVIRQQFAVETPFGVQIREIREPVADAAVPEWLTLITCMFLHGGWLHLIGNMWFLYVFGDNVEDRLGHVGFSLLYLGTGVFAGLAHLATNFDSPIPTVGASGAIAGVMGAYMLLYPRAQVITLIPIFFFLHTTILPAYLFLGIWFALQFLQGFGSIGDVTTGVAWWAHVGGFAAGAAVAWLIEHSPLSRPPVKERELPYRNGRSYALRSHR